MYCECCLELPSHFAFLGHLLYVPLSPGQHRLGGTALAQCFSQLGEHPPDLDLPENLVRAFHITQGLLKGERGPGTWGRGGGVNK